MTGSGAFRVWEPAAAPIPVLINSPHSGMTWPPDFQPAASRHAVLTTWDAYVDELWSDARLAGATVMAAQFPRAYADANRAEDDIDPNQLADQWPTPLSPTHYSRRGLGLIRARALPSVPMYDRPLTAADVERRLARYYRPYRAAVVARLDALHSRFAVAWHIDAHSMKSVGNAMNHDSGARRPDVVVSDRLGTTADPVHTRWVAEWFSERGYTTSVNVPYQGGDLVASTGAPAAGRHSIQLEFNRALYMDEATFVRGPRFAAVRAHCLEFVQALAGYVAAQGR